MTFVKKTTLLCGLSVLGSTVTPVNARGNDNWFGEAVACVGGAAALGLAAYGLYRWSIESTGAMVERVRGDVSRITNRYAVIVPAFEMSIERIYPGSIYSAVSMPEEALFVLAQWMYAANNATPSQIRHNANEVVTDLADVTKRIQEINDDRSGKDVHYFADLKTLQAQLRGLELSLSFMSSTVNNTHYAYFELYRKELHYGNAYAPVLQAWQNRYSPSEFQLNLDTIILRIGGKYPHLQYAKGLLEHINDLRSAINSVRYAYTSRLSNVHKMVNELDSIYSLLVTSPEYYRQRNQKQQDQLVQQQHEAMQAQIRLSEAEAERARAQARAAEEKARILRIEREERERLERERKIEVFLNIFR